MNENTSTEITPVTTVTVPAVQPKWKSWTMWVSIAGAFWLILNSFGIPQKLGFTADTYNTVFNAIGIILIALGIVNNPTSTTTL